MTLPLMNRIKFVICDMDQLSNNISQTHLACALAIVVCAQTSWLLQRRNVFGVQAEGRV